MLYDYSVTSKAFYASGAGWTQLIDSDSRYISMMEKGRGIGKDLLDRLCVAFGVDEEAFTWQEANEREEAADSLPRVTRMILEELEAMPEYEQLRLLAEMVERRFKKLEAQQKEKCLSPGRGHRGRRRRCVQR